MTRLLFLCCLLPLIFANSFLYDSLMELNLSEEQLESIYTFSPQRAASGFGCDSVAFLHAQYGFNQMLGINTQLTWRNASSIWVAIGRLTTTPDKIINICTARQLFASTLGYGYTSCIDPLYLIAQGQTTFTNALLYTHMHKHLEFSCGGGLGEYINDFNCIIPDNSAMGDCKNAFNQTIHQNPNALCQDVPTYLACVANAYSSKCGASAGWTMCEYERVGYAFRCPGMRCFI